MLLSDCWEQLHPALVSGSVVCGSELLAVGSEHRQGLYVSLLPMVGLWGNITRAASSSLNHHLCHATFGLSLQRWWLEYKSHALLLKGSVWETGIKLNGGWSAWVPFLSPPASCMVPSSICSSFWSGGVLTRGEKKRVDVWEVLEPVPHRGVIGLPGPLWPSLALYCVSWFFHYPLVFIPNHLPL